MHSLPLFVNLKGRSVILLGEGPAAEAKRVLLERAGAEIVEENAEAVLAIVAITDDGEAEAAVERLKARGILVNAVDRPDHCDFTLPAIVDRDPVLIAIATGGASAGLAKALRQRFERLLPSGLGRLAEGLRAERESLRSKWPEADERRRALDAALDEGGPLDPLVRQEEGAPRRWLRRARHGTAHGANQFETVELRSTDPDDLTIGETLLLGRADRIFLAPGVPEAITHRARSDAERISVDAPPDNPGPGLSVFIAAPK